ncbi:hypothetical protein SDC9_86666 [bioreactor metagenome]|uniref:Uncharacterized protein n=1 Tax=bioreactor metagenome TaxID=1076179 RepID=A0A644ZI75_9ZZZZ
MEPGLGKNIAGVLVEDHPLWHVFPPESSFVADEKRFAAHKAGIPIMGLYLIPCFPGRGEKLHRHAEKHLVGDSAPAVGSGHERTDGDNDERFHSVTLKVV